MATIDAAELPWLIDIMVNMTPIAHVTFNTHSIDNSAIRNGYLESSTAQNSEVSFWVVLAAGTWTIELMYVKNGNAGIYTVQLDGATAGTIDAYGLAYNTRSSITGIAVTSTGKKVLRLWLNTKNASSTGYYALLQHIQLRRTA